MHTDSLFSIKQQEEEDLWKYVACFNAATLEVKNFDEIVAMSILKRRVWSNRLIFSLNKNFSDTYNEMLDQMWKYAQTEKEEAITKQTNKNKNKNEKKQPREDNGAQ